MGGLAIIFTGLAGVNVLLALSILYVYLSSYMKAKAPFTLALIVFAGLFLFENILDLIFLLLDPDAFAGFLGTHNALVNVVQLAGLAVLAKITWK
ncbi:MAG: hypothetical protein KKA90_02945 [Nanoarchaeota archaeon]|nr:hypothetical protein [Nanoarchaeota archaeon]